MCVRWIWALIIILTSIILIEKFAETHKCVFFSAMEKNDSMNLKDFSELVQRTPDGNFIAPCTENCESKKGIYKISDNFFNFWYRYEFANKNYYSLIVPDKAVDGIIENINDYMGPIFESICQQYLVEKVQKGEMPIVPFYFGKWWGNNPAIKARDDVDILALNKSRDKGLFCECKFKNSKFDSKDFEDVLDSLKYFLHLKSPEFIFLASLDGQRVLNKLQKNIMLNLLPWKTYFNAK